MDMKIFVDTDADFRLSRRVLRDIAERGRDLKMVLNQYERTVKPSFEKFILPVRAREKKFCSIFFFCASFSGFFEF